MPYQIEGRDVLFDWLSREPDPNKRETFLGWLIDFAEDPLIGAQRVPGIRGPVFITFVPVKPRLVLRFVVYEQFKAVKVINIVPLP